MRTSTGDGIRKQLASLCVSASSVSGETKEKLAQFPWKDIDLLASDMMAGRLELAVAFLRSLPRHDKALRRAIGEIQMERRDQRTLPLLNIRRNDARSS